MHKTSVKLLLCKATYFIAEIQKVGNPERHLNVVRVAKPLVFLLLYKNELRNNSLIKF